MGFGMIGALGGAGAALGKEADYLYKEEEKNADDTRARSLQGWLMAKREEYAIAGEGRAETRTIASEGRAETRTIASEDRASTRREREKDNDNARYIREAEGRRNVVVEDDKAKARAKSAVAAETLDTDVKVEAGHAEAKETSATKKLHNAQADYWSGAKTDAANAAAGSKMNPADKAELASVQALVKEKQTLIDRSRADGSWDDKNLTEGQKKLQSDVVAMTKRERDLLASYRKADTATTASADPLGQRGGAPTPTARIGNRPDADQTSILQTELRRATAKAASATDPDERKRAELDADAVRNEMRRLNIQPQDAAPAATPVSAPAGGSMVGPAAAPAAKPPTVVAPIMPLNSGKAPAPQAPNTARAQLEAITGGGYIPDDYNFEGNGTPRSAPAAGGKPAAYDRAAAAEQLKARTAAPAASAADPLLVAMGAEGGSAIAQQQAAGAPQLRAMADEIRAAQAQVAQAGKSQQQGAVQAAMAKVQEASARLNAMLKDMNPAQAAAIKKALGVV